MSQTDTAGTHDPHDNAAARLEEARDELRGSMGRRGKAVRVLAVLAVFYTLYFAASIVLPFLLATILFLLLSPLMRFLNKRARLPRVVAALILILGLFLLVAGIGAAIAVPASGWIAKAPEALPTLQHKLGFLKQPIDAATAGYHQVMQALGQEKAGKAPDGGASPAGSIASVGGSILMMTKTMLGQAFTVLLVLFFLLSSGDTLLRRLVEVLPSWEDKKRAVQIASEIESNVAHYLATITMMNALVGIAAGLAMWLLGLGDPLLWGTFAFLLNYIPIIGPSVGILCFFAVGLFTFDHPLYAFIPAGIYLLIHVLEGETVTPMLLAKRLTLNPVLVIASLFFWDWMWGVVGALLSVPLLAIAKIVCDRLPGLAALGHMLGSEGDEQPKPE